MFAEIDKNLRNIFSFLYRIIISAYVLLILNFKLGWENIPWGKVSLVITVYLLLSYILKSKNSKDEENSILKKEKYKAWLRLAIDYSVIIYFVNGSDLNIFHNYFIVVLPIINSINHSLSDNKNSIVYLCSILGILFLDNWSFFESHYVPVVVLFLIVQFFKLRYRISRYKDKLFQIIDDFYGANSSKREMSSILTSLKDQINETLKGVKFGDLEITNICCFKQKNNKLILISTGELIENYRFDEIAQLIDELNINDRKQNVLFYVNNELEKFNVIFKAKGNFYTYMYAITFSKPIILVNSIFTLRLVIEPSFKHLSKLLEVKWIISNERRKLYEDVRKKHEYVIKSMEVLHFVKGALSPFSILNSAITRFKDDIDEERKLKTLQRIYSLSERSNANMETIANRAEMIYDKENNPFVSDKMEDHTFQELFAWIRRSWEEATDSKNIILVREIESDIRSYNLRYDEELLDAVLIEIFTNISKYSGDFKQLYVEVTNENVSVRFSNNLHSISNKKVEEIKRLVSKHNTEMRPSINQRESERFGLYIIKDYLYQMNMSSRINLDQEKIYSHTIIIKKS